MATTVDSTVKFNGDRWYMVDFTFSGAEGTTETSVIDCSAVAGPDGVTGSGKFKLVEALWNLNGYDNVTLYLQDETNEEVILEMTGEGSYNAHFTGGGAIDVEAATPTEDDYDVQMNIVDSGDTGIAGNIQMVFAKRLSRL